MFCRESTVSVFKIFKLTAEAYRHQSSVGNQCLILRQVLSHTLNYEPHKGKLKQWEQSKENNSFNEHVNRVSFYKKLINTLFSGILFAINNYGETIYAKVQKREKYEWEENLGGWKEECDLVGIV